MRIYASSRPAFARAVQPPYIHGFIMTLPVLTNRFSKLVAVSGFSPKQTSFDQQDPALISIATKTDLLWG
jgi:hypothetical protein